MFLTSTIGVATLAVGRVDVEVDVGVDPQASLLHVAVGDAQVRQAAASARRDRPWPRAASACRAALTISSSGVPARFRSMRLSASPACFVVHALAGVFFQMGADDADLLGLEAPLGIADLQLAVVAERQIVLADLIALGQVGIVIVLAVPLGERRDLAVRAPRPSCKRQLERLGGSSPAACPACRCRPGRSACSAARRIACCSRRTACSA